MKTKRIILGSQSPRRQGLIKELGLPVEIMVSDVEEVYPSDLDPENVPRYLAKLKASGISTELNEGDLLITSDTIVLLNNDILEKPRDKDHAINMIKRLSNTRHEVLTCVYLKSCDHDKTLTCKTSVFFDELTNEEIEHYVDKFKPYDKAGSYGIQEWIGFIGIKKIEGCYYNVMGLPLHDIYQCMKREF